MAYTTAVEWREQWSPGETAFFEYHCTEADDSADAHLWHRSHQVVTVVRLQGADENDAIAVLGPDATYDERAEAALPFTYTVRFADGHYYYRPDPPKGAL